MIHGASPGPGGRLQNNPLPNGITRDFVPTPEGALELLTGRPDLAARPKRPDKPPLLLQHGGVGCAEMYLDFISYFCAPRYDCYALSIRGHGHSFRPNWWWMTFGVSAEDLAGDIAAGVKHVKELRGREPVLLGHSNGGGLSQLMLDHGMATVAGLILMASAPNFGGNEVNKNWMAVDRWFIPRVFYHLLHPLSPLSSPFLVHQIFFSPEFPIERVHAFSALRPDTEAFRWATAMTKPNFVDARKVLLGCGGRLLVVGGERDLMFPPRTTKRMGEEYDAALKGLAKDKKVDARGQDGEAASVPVEIIQRSGHHVQNDLYWKDAADVIVAWLEHV